MPRLAGWSQGALWTELNSSHCRRVQPEDPAAAGPEGGHGGLGGGGARAGGRAAMRAAQPQPALLRRPLHLPRARRSALSSAGPRPRPQAQPGNLSVRPWAGLLVSMACCPACPRPSCARAGPPRTWLGQGSAGRPLRAGQRNTALLQQGTPAGMGELKLMRCKPVTRSLRHCTAHPILSIARGQLH